MLKQITFIGFKSFADKVVVDFSNGITGVIGPNGCGKSNIFDGIRWVLGEQSAKSLRGGKMEDVIFAGAETRKPGEFAEVTLVLDNTKGIFKSTDEVEIAVRRRTSRKGGSEYTINDQPARLKDIHDLFLDSGIGSNSYSMIGQGQIEKILSTKVEERRAIFEEAAGIVKLRNQKESTEKRLEEVTHNMLRIEDVVKEIERQLFPLQEQASKAAEYVSLSEELQTIEVQYLLHELDDLEIKMSDAIGSISEFENHISTMDAQMEHSEQTLEELKATFQNENERVFSLQEELSSLQTEIEKRNGNRTLINERIDNTKKTISEIENNLTEIEENFSLSAEDFRVRQERVTLLEESLINNEELLRQITEDLSRFESKKIRLRTDIEFARNKTTEEYNLITAKSIELETSSKKEDEFKEKIEVLNEKLKCLKNENKQFEKEAKEQILSFETSKIEFENAQSSFLNKQDEVKGIRNQLEVASTVLNEKKNELYRAKTKLEQLETLIESNEGYFDGVKAILNDKSNPAFKGVIGTVADSIQTKKKYELAIETLLQSSMQFIIVENSEDAKSCVNELKTKQLGRATFLPLDLASTIHLSKEEEKIISDTDGITLALEMVSYPTPVGSVISSLLGRSIIAETMDVALAFLKSSKSKLKIATLEGELIQSGSISGGASKKQKTGLLTRKREVVDFKNLSQSLQSDVEQLSSEFASMKNKISTLDEELAADQDQIEILRNTMQNKRILFEEVQRKVASYEEKKQEIEIQIQENKLLLKDSQQTLLGLRLLVEERRKSHKKSSESLDAFLDEQTVNDSNLSDTTAKKTDILLEMTSSQEELRQIKEYLEEFNQDNDSIEEKIERYYAKKSKELALIDESKETINQLEKELESFQFQHEKLHKDLMFAKSENAKRHQNIEHIEVELKEVRQSKEKIEKDLNSKTVFLSKRETEKTNILSRLLEMYELQEEDLLDIERLVIDFAASKKEVEKIKKRISSLGNINHAAIEDCKNLEERYGTEKTQLTDIQSAKADLDKLLKNVETEMTDRFTSTFKEIAEHFSKIFVDMFEGGMAKISLVDEKDPLNTAIEIIAQPPGKKPQTINSLSGGEKAFTSVSLIFAIISAKPSPFVILDEVDAALDDANVARFARTLRKFAEKSQFITISHRKSTMLVSDFLYGVSQETPGVTILFPYSLDDIQTKKLS